MPQLFDFDVNNNLKADLKAYYKSEEASGGSVDFWGGHFEKDTADTLTTNLNAYFTMDEHDGSRSDEILTSNLTDNNTVTFAVGKKGRAAQFTSTNLEYLSIASNSNLAISNGSFTICCWVYLDSKTLDMAIVAKANLTKREYLLLYHSSSDRFQFYADSDLTGSQPVAASTFGSPSTGTWYFIRAWYDAVAGTINISINNGTADSVSVSGSPSSGTASFKIGARLESPIDYFDGRIDEVGIWAKVLSSQEASDLYNGGNGNSYTRTATLTDNNTVTQNEGRRGYSRQHTRANREYFSSSNTIKHRVGDTDFTLAAWVWLDSKPSGGIMGIVSKYDTDGHNGVGVREYTVAWRQSSDHFEFAITNTDDFLEATNAGATSTGQWYLVIVWHDSVNDMMYIQINNGTPNSKATVAGVSESGLDDFEIGSRGFRSDSNEEWDGRIDEVALWKRILTADERTELWNSGGGNTMLTYRVRTNTLAMVA